MGQMTLFNTAISHCQICGRLLTNGLSVRLGIGPICRGTIFAGGDTEVAEHTDGLADFAIGEPLNPNGLLLRRDENGVWTNVPHIVIQHSQTGFEFGYGGSGPADLALNVVEVLLHHLGYSGERIKCFDGTCFDLAYSLHQAFKWEFIASSPREGARIPYADVLAWVRARAMVSEV